MSVGLQNVERKRSDRNQNWGTIHGGDSIEQDIEVQDFFFWENKETRKKSIGFAEREIEVKAAKD